MIRSLAEARRSRGLAFVALSLALTLAAAAAAAQEPPKIAVVDIDRVVIESKAGQALQQRLAELEQETQQQLDEKIQLIQTLRESLVNQTGSEARQTQKRIEDESLAGQRLREDAERQAAKVRQEELQRIRDSLRPVLERIQQEDSYDLILNSNPAIIIAASDRIDITERVLELIDGE
jgi:Skp family chaperone for outer membrane proteins